MTPLISALQQRGLVPRFHGNGFTQLPLGGQRRLHIWHPSLPPIEGHNATIHNHVWDMQSRVLVGCLTHRTYAQTKIVSDDGPYDLYTAGEGGPDYLFGRTDVRVSGEYHMSEGSIYVFPAGEYHESDVPGHILTATLMEKRPASIPAGDRPGVLCPRGEPPVDAFAPEHQPTVSRMWEVVQDAVESMTHTSHREIEASIA